MNPGNCEIVITNVRNVMIYFLDTFLSVDSAILWLVGDFALIGFEITAVRYVGRGYCRGEEDENEMTLLARCRGRNIRQPSVLYNRYLDQITSISSSSSD
jgi:hypothetical protein